MLVARHTVRDLARSVRLASRRYAPDWGYIAYPGSWWEAPRDPPHKLSLLVDNLFCRAVMSIDIGWRARLDRSSDGSICSLILSKADDIAVYPITMTVELLQISRPDGSVCAPLRLADGGGPIIACLASLCGEFFGDDTGSMTGLDAEPSLGIADAH